MSFREEYSQENIYKYTRIILHVIREFMDDIVIVCASDKSIGLPSQQNYFSFSLQRKIIHKNKKRMCL